MKRSSQKSGRRILTIICGALLAGLAFFLFLPSSYYIRRSLLHWAPKIDQYSIFENRVVKANDPQPWHFSVDCKGKTIAPRFVADFDKFKTVSFVVVQHNQILLEQYWDGYSQLSYCNSFSMSKTIISLLVGCAIKDGSIKSVDERVSDFFPITSSFEDRKLTIRNLLTMSAGFDWDEYHPAPFSKNTELYYGDDLWKVVSSVPVISKPGMRFNYQSIATQLLGFILCKSTGISLSQYASEKLWTPVQAEEDALWSLDKKDGMEKAYTCFHSNARDFARLGQLVLNKGRWNDRQVVDSTYIRQMTTPADYLLYVPDLPRGNSMKPTSRPCEFYGFHCWILQYKGYTIPYFRGYLGQYIFVIPSLDAVIVRLGKSRDEHYNYDQNYPKDIEIWLDAGLAVIDKVKIMK